MNEDDRTIGRLEAELTAVHQELLRHQDRCDARHQLIDSKFEELSKQIGDLKERMARWAGVMMAVVAAGSLVGPLVTTTLEKGLDAPAALERANAPQDS